MNREQSNQETVKITLRLRLPVFSFVALLMAAILFPDRVWNTLLIGLGGMFLVSYVWIRQLAAGLHAERIVHAQWVAVGDIIRETFRLHNMSAVPALWVEVIDQSNVPGYQVAVVRSPGQNRLDTWHETAVCLQRGHYQIGPWLIRAGDPFGIFTCTRNYPATREIVIHPPIHSNLPFRLPAGQRSGRKRARQRSLQATINAASIRAYAHGDPQRWIHWPSSARHNELFVRQFDLDAAGDIWLLLDMEQSIQCGQGLESTEEYAVLLAASISARAIQQNRPIGLASYGQTPQIISTNSGGGQQWRILRALAYMHADGTASLAAALLDLGKIAKRGSAVIIISASPESNWIPELLHLAQRGIESNVILLDRPSFGGEGVSQGQQDAIRHLGINCQMFYQGEINTQLPESNEKSKIKITPFGKAVMVED